MQVPGIIEGDPVSNPLAPPNFQFTSPTHRDDWPTGYRPVSEPRDRVLVIRRWRSNAMVSRNPSARLPQCAGFDKSEAGCLILRHDSISKTLPLLNARRAGALCARQSRAASSFRSAERRPKALALSTGATAALTYATAFVDQKNERKPVLLLLSDKKTSDRKMEDRIRHHARWIEIQRDRPSWTKRAKCSTAVHVKDRQTAVSGIFHLKLDNPASKELTGSAIAIAKRAGATNSTSRFMPP